MLLLIGIGDWQTVAGLNADGGRGVLTGVTLARESGLESKTIPTSIPFIVSNESVGNGKSNDSDENIGSWGAGELVSDENGPDQK